jgi:hypothetical protein
MPRQGKPENLKPFKKGQSGNPKGRPKLPDLREALANVLGDEKEGKTAVEAILMALRKKAVAGDTKAAQILLDRGYGGAVQKVMNTDEEGKPLPQVILQGAKIK